MTDRADSPDSDNPEFDFTTARERRDGEPRSSDATRLRRALREIEKAENLGVAQDLARRALRG